MKRRLLFPMTFKGKAAAIVCVCCFFLFFFRSVLFEGQQFSFRDCANFYYPMFEYIHSYWKSGTVPLWDPNENVGQPLAASASAAVFYPGQLIFFLSDLLPISYGFCFALYHLLHMVLAWVAMFFLCRHWKISFGGSLLSATCYTFCGSIFGQFCNTIFLVGAAWLPLGILFGDRLLLKRDIRSFVLLAAVLAMMVLGGEPQSTYFCGLLLGGLWFVYYRGGAFRDFKTTDSSNPQRQNTSQLQNTSLIARLMTLFKCRLAILCYAALLGGLLCFVQLVLTMEMTPLSDRVTDEMPFSIWEIPGFAVKNAAKQSLTTPAEKSPYIFYDAPDFSDKSMLDLTLDGLFCRRLEYGGHSRVIYHFSMGPWRLGELLWPNITGKSPPNGSRWSSYLPEDYAWTYSLYFGIAPMLLALAATTWKIRRHTPVAAKKKNRKHRREAVVPVRTSTRRMLRVWCTWVGLLFLLGALGGFGPRWFLRAMTHIMGHDNKLIFENGDPVGGVYWFLCVMLPKFSSFRFPGKLITPAILGLTVLVGIGWDCGRKNKRLVPVIVVYSLVSLALVLLVAVLGNKAFDMSKVADYSVGAIFDSYDATKAWMVVLAGITQGLIVALVFAVFYLSPEEKSRLFRLLSFRFRTDTTSAAKSVTAKHETKSARRLSSRQRMIFTIVCFVLIGADIYIANENILVTSPQSIFNTTPRYVQTIKDCEQKNAAGGVASPRYLRFNWMPFIFVNPKSTATITDRIVWERDTVKPKFNEPDNFACIFGSVSLGVNDYAVVQEWLEWNCGHRDMTPFLAFLGCRYIISPVMLQSEKTPDVEVRLNEQWTRLIHSTKNLTDEQLKTLGLPVSSMFWEITLPTDRVKILRNPELDHPDWTTVDQLNSGNANHALDGEYAKITRFEPNSLDIDVKLNQPASIVLVEQYYPGWYARVAPLKDPTTTVPVEITKTLDFMRRVELPAGEFRVTMEYAPPRFYFAAAVTLVSWCVVILGFVFAGLVKRSLLVKRKLGNNDV